MHLLLSLPAHLAAEGHFIVSADTTASDQSTADTTATTESDETNTSLVGSIVGILPLLAIPFALYFLLIRPQRRRVRDQQAVQSSLEVGDEILTTAGVYGFITGFEEGTGVVWVEIDDDVQIRVTRAAISGKVNTSAGTEAGGTDAPEAPSTGRPSLKGSTKPDGFPSGDADK